MSWSIWASGRQRTGCAGTEQALAVARRIANSNSLSFGGVQAYAGHLQHTAEIGERQRLGAIEAAKVGELVERLRGDRLAPRLVTGGGTGTYALDADGGVHRAAGGWYVFMDDQYRGVAMRPARPDAVRALTVRAHHRDQRQRHGARHDGCRPQALRHRRAASVIRLGAPAGAEYHFFGDEHGRVELPDAPRHLPVGTALECLAPHCDPTVNLYDIYHVVHGDTLIDIWPVDARGAT